MPSYRQDLFDIEIETIENDKSSIDVTETKKYFELYEYLDLENLNFLTGRLRWRENIEILDSLSWYQPLKAQDEYTYHYDQENNLSLYLNIYESRYLHLNLKNIYLHQFGLLQKCQFRLHLLPSLPFLKNLQHKLKF